MQYLAGRYRLIERRGMGGMSVVWCAFDEVLVRPVAVKVLAPRFAADPGSRGRIRDEAQAAARLCHPYITNVYDYGESTTKSGSTMPFVVMELVDGKPLDARLVHGPLPWPLAVEVCAQVASALAAVHARGLVHRDVKPANVVLTVSGAKLVDFGISAVAGDLPERGRQVLGTPAYLAPERLDGGPADAASDVYALGLVLYKALAGRLPWDAETTTQMLTAHCYLRPDPLPLIPGLPANVVDLCHRCLAKQPHQRPSSAEVARVLAAVAGIRVPLVGVPFFSADHHLPDATTAAASTVEPALPPARRRRRRRFALRGRRARAGLLGAGLAAAAIALATCSGFGEQRQAPVAQAAQEAPGGLAARVAEPRVGCQVEYATASDVAGTFVVTLKVINTGAMPVEGWTLTFSYPGNQQIIEFTPGQFTQEGQRVSVRDSGVLAPTGGAAAFVVTGLYQGVNPMPSGFELNGRSCGQSLIAAPAPAVPPAAGAAGGGSHRDEGRSRDEGEDRGKGKRRGGDD